MGRKGEYSEERIGMVGGEMRREEEEGLRYW